MSGVYKKSGLSPSGKARQVRQGKSLFLRFCHGYKAIRRTVLAKIAERASESKLRFARTSLSVVDQGCSFNSQHVYG